MKDYHMTASIHTVSVRCEGIITNIQHEVAKCIECMSYDEKRNRTSLKINVHKLGKECLRYSEFIDALETILSGAGVTDYVFKRVDVRLDSYEDEHYQKFMKLNRILVSLLATTYRVRNKYRCTDLFSQKQLSIAVKNERFEIEHYDKARESHNRDRAKSRLELRIKKWDIPLKYMGEQFQVVWAEKWGKALKNYWLMQVQYNNELEELYKENSNTFPKVFRGLTAFIIQYQECIFSKSQLIELFGRFSEVKNARNRERNHRQRQGIIYYSEDDVKVAISEIQNAMQKYFES